MSEKIKAASASRESIMAAMTKFSMNLDKARTRRIGSILLRLAGQNGGDFYIVSTERGCSVKRERGIDAPQFEVIGDATRICRILNRTKEGRLQFYAGGIRVLGDLQYLSDLAHEMGFIKEPF